MAPPEEAGPARRLLVGGTIIEGAATLLMEHRLGLVGEPYKQGTTGKLAKAAKGLRAAGALLATVGVRRRRGPALAGAAFVLAGEVCLRWAVFRAGFQSARDPRYTIVPQRSRIEQGDSTGK